ncbi:hypothetical protein [Salipiger mucosus]|uniref:Uncharacterized protein n=1 Tax=Salipiger mucosus DSM 16094 TaxID=1123237 RepID=S9SBG4_9RHOB|nr:hypothetical protein [Salipiger mucosus]EPX83559.1 hypothetical protein Salmuc_02167 [Salipiger mucosus DSM 16094]
MRRFSVVGAMMLSLSFPGAGWAEDVDLDALRAAMEKYKDVEVALADGYIPDPSGHCVSAAAEGLPAELGGMGIHYLQPALLGITGDKPRVNGNGIHTDWMAPAILLYEPQEDGSLELVGIENLVWQAAWAETGHAHPEINGRMWDAMADDLATVADEAHGFEPHFDQHVWLFRENPNGDLEPFNPAVTCEHHMTH